MNSTPPMDYAQYEQAMRQAMKKNEQEKQLKLFLGTLFNIAFWIVVAWFVLGQPDLEAIMRYVESIH